MPSRKHYQGFPKNPKPYPHKKELSVCCSVEVWPTTNGNKVLKICNKCNNLCEVKKEL